MDPMQASTLRALLEQQQVAALATLHKGEPAQSMVPYALLPDGRGFCIHVSRLAAHTADMLANPAVSLLVMAPPGSATTPQELPRANVRGHARPCPPEDADYEEARALYLARFPASRQAFNFSDFSLFIVEPRSVRFVGGFARATTVRAAELAALMSGEV